MPEKKSPNRIPADKSQAWSSWSLPFVADNGQVVPSVEKEKKDNVVDKKKKESESIEDIYLDKYPSLKGMKADLLQEVIVAAEQEGLKKGQQEGFERGHAEGYEAGKIKAYADTKQALLDEQNTFSALIESMVSPLQASNEKIDTLLLTMVQRLTRAVVRRELLLDSGDILEVIHAAINAIPAGWKSVSIALNPKDFVVVETYNQAHQLNWVLNADESIVAGGVLVTTDDSVVNDTVTQRLDEILESFLTQKNVDESFEPEPALKPDDPTPELKPEPLVSLEADSVAPKVPVQEKPSASQNVNTSGNDTIENAQVSKDEPLSHE